MTQEDTHLPLFSIKSTRFWLCVLLTFGLTTTVSMRVNLSMAVVCMVNSTVSEHHTQRDDLFRFENESKEDTCPKHFETSEAAERLGYNGDLPWSLPMQSVLFSATFYGGLVTIGFSGYFADRFGPKWILLVAGLDYVLITLLTPVLAKWSFEGFLMARIIMGLGEGFISPSQASFVSRWYTRNERSTVAALYTSGNQIAAGLTTVVSAYMCSSDAGWPSIFYLTGFGGIVYCVLWFIFASNNPNNNRWISTAEKEYLAVHVKRTKKPKFTPWKRLLTSPPLIVAVICQFGYTFQIGMLHAFLPTYLKDSLRLPLETNGVYNMVPYISQLISKNILGFLADYLKRKEILKHTTCSKLFQTLGSFGTALCLLALAYIPNCNHPQTAIPILAIYGFFFSAVICGFFTSLLSLAPTYSGTIGSIAMFFGMLGNMAGPMLLGLFSKVEQIQNYKWETLFVTCSFVNMLGGVLFLMYGSADVQSWADTSPKTKN